MSEVIPATGTAVSTWDPNSGAALPAHIADALGDMGTNIPERNTVPSLSYEGKTWSIVKDGNKHKMQSTNDDGDLVPVQVMRLVILNFNGERGRAYYPGVYDPNNSSAPVCWSADGVAPDETVKEKQCGTCKACPQAVKGSKIQDGKEMVACSQHRMIAIAPAFEIDSDPLRLKIAVTSDWDKDVVEHGWFAFRQYVDFLKSRGITHTALVVTKVKFDPNAQYPKLLFAIDRLLTQDETAQVKTALANPKVGELLNEKWTAAGVDGVDKNGDDMAPHDPLAAAVADGWVPHPDAPGYHYKGQDVVANTELVGRYPAPEAAAPPPPPPPPPPAPAPAPEAAPAAATGLAAAVADGWVPHPDAPGYHYKGQDVVADGELETRYGGVPASTPAPEPTPAPTPSGIEAALADGWVPHPDAPDYHYKGQEVVADGDLAARYPSPGAPSSAAPAPETTSAPSQASASAPGEPVVDADVAALLGKWTGDA